MIQYQVIQINHSDYIGKETITIKGIFDTFNRADRLAKKLYEEIIDFWKTDTIHNIERKGRYIEFQEVSGGGKKAITSFIVNEIEFEMNKECEIEIN